MKTYDPLQPPPWVREAMRGRRRAIKVNPEDDAGMDAYLDGALRRAPKAWHDELDAIIGASMAKGKALK